MSTISRRTCLRMAAFAGLTGAAAQLMAPVSAHADTASELAAAQAELEAIGEEYQAIQDDLAEASLALEVTKGEIEETALELAEAQETLAAQVAADYMNGSGNILEVILGATDFNDLISRLFYINKVSQAQTEAIEAVQDLQAKLEDTEAEQQERLEETQEKLDELAANQEAAAALVDSLDEQLQEELAAAAAESAALEAAMQAAEEAGGATTSTSVTGTSTASEAAESSADVSSSASSSSSSTSSSSSESGSSSAASSDSSSSTTSSSSSSESTSSSEDTTDSSSSSSSSSSSNDGSVCKAALAIALQYEGWPYVYGGKSPSAGGFDCSGLVYYAFKCVGVTLPGSASTQGTWFKNNATWITSKSDLQYGDVCFFSGHVAFYVGDGNVFGARRSGVVASTTKMSYFPGFYGAGRL